MTKYAAYGAELDIGTPQVETATVVGTITGSGDATFTLTASGMTGTGDPIAVAVLDEDTADTVATKAVAVFNAMSDITDFFTCVANGPNVILTRVAAAANDGTMNLAYTNGDCTGLTPDAESTATTAGVAATETAGVTNIGGPGLSLDTEDVTTHDQSTAWEEHVATVLRSGEVTLDIIYDPAGGTHDATTGLNYRLENKTYSYFDLIFRSTYNWTFFGYVTGFEPGSPIDGALTASVTVKITGAPTLE